MQSHVLTCRPVKTMDMKKSTSPLNYGWCLLYPRIMKQSNLPSEQSKTVQITPPGFYGGFATVTMVCYGHVVLTFSFFLFVFISSLKNHSKSQKNHKIENLILLDST